MADRECGKLLAPINEEYIGANHERTCPQLGQACEGGVEVALVLACRTWSFSRACRPPVAHLATERRQEWDWSG